MTEVWAFVAGIGVGGMGGLAAALWFSHRAYRDVRDRPSSGGRA